MSQQGMGLEMLPQLDTVLLETLGSARCITLFHIAAAHQTINLSWNAQSNAATTGIVTQWHVWRSLTSGVYTDGYFVVNNATSFSDDGTKTINTGTMGAGSPVNQPEITSIKYSSIERVITTFIPPFSDNGFDTRTSVTRLYLTDKCGKQIFECDLQRVYNQSGWNGGRYEFPSQALYREEAFKCYYASHLKKHDSE